jgi:hypothetical protein
MALYFFKPVVWNDKGYQRPGGAHFVSSGFPAENGFGDEEWNNSTKLDIVQGGERLHIFHTEGFGNKELDEFPGAIFIFMIASHRGKQFLVSIAGNATSRISDAHRKERLQILKLIEPKMNFAEDAWSVSSVRRAFQNNRSRFQALWRTERHWLPNWKCPVELYLGLTTPVELDPRSLTGRKRLVQMYGRYQEIDRSIALGLLDIVRSRDDSKIVSNLIAACGSDILRAVDDIQRLTFQENVSETSRKRLTDARLGQGKFRTQLDSAWGNACAVTGCSIQEVLRASHIKPWYSSNNRERLDPENGILLTAHLDALFDAGLISFDDAGAILKATLLVDDGNPQLSVSGRLHRPPSEKMKKYLAYHRNIVFRNPSKPVS